MNIIQFLTTSLPPRYGHQLNWLESIGNTLLFLFALTYGTFFIKDLNKWACIYATALMAVTMPLTILGAILKSIGYVLPHKEVLATDESYVPTNPLKLTQSYELSQVLKKIFLENGLIRKQNGEEQPSFVLVSGTVLGAIRHGGITPWDDDCDFALFKEDEEKFLTLKNSFEKEGVEIHSKRYDSTYKLRFSDEKLIEKYGEEATFHIGGIDLFIWSKMSDGSYTYDKILTRSRRITEFFSPSDMKQGFKMRPFGPLEKKLTLPLLIEPDEYLSRVYGKFYNDFGIATHTHITLDFGKLGSVQIIPPKMRKLYFKIEKWKGIPGMWL